MIPYSVDLHWFGALKNSVNLVHTIILLYVCGIVFAGMKSMQTSMSTNKKSYQSAGSTNPRPPPPIDRHKSFDKDDFSTEPMVTKKVDTGPINYTRYSFAELKMATDNFSVENIIGEGSIGCVYRGRFDGKVYCFLA